MHLELCLQKPFLLQPKTSEIKVMSIASVDIYLPSGTFDFEDMVTTFGIFDLNQLVTCVVISRYWFHHSDIQRLRSTFHCKLASFLKSPELRPKRLLFINLRINDQSKCTRGKMGQSHHTPHGLSYYAPNKLKTSNTSHFTSLNVCLDVSMDFNPVTLIMLSVIPFMTARYIYVDAQRFPILTFTKINVPILKFSVLGSWYSGIDSSLAS
ncbi:hypothetical protein AGLY_003402 [Aphis glycines]|uniref:Uncharacterized protein n=1 Tax=Aphis glycines TaxID=307491 RepID=A0A6G0TZK7_APHGL|nr:hypothetical protein AGLY_003402 [Aphis glycines]